MEEFRINKNNGMEIGLYTLGDHVSDPRTGEIMSEHRRMKEMVAMAKLAEDAGLDVYGVGESHQKHFIASSTPTILAAIASATEKIKLISSSTVLSADDPVRVYEQFSTLDLLSDGRAEIVTGRGSRYGVYELFGYDMKDFEELFEEKIDLLLKLNSEQKITWSGKFRPALNDAEIFPKPLSGKLPIWRAVGGKPASAIKAGKIGMPMHLAALYGASSVFKHTVDAYHRTATEAGFDSAKLPVAMATMMYLDKDSQTALKEYYPYLNNTFTQLRGTPFPKDRYAEATSVKNAIMVGSPQQIIEKILYQYELYGHQRFIVQIDHGNLPFKKIQEMIEMFATEVVPAIRKATKGSN
ncbi:LLM class flavin-dependent oxidoreductase [Oceanobacillus arenosus]|uniref:LLM class flavin-dependent oxidoreductase n=1 Tax=Oceanobacillus arenosus TaxID=1229153 RepID=A0A3D8PTI7_9BACI|nr:LLM class flavin-dependent oxidoreductase [Oceanobacillus arenosus]RDW19436.1 LLM class flavin-dependent oxidoreductase [Oceanobacillus arenosus]